MPRLARIVLIGLLGTLGASVPASAQTTTNHLHQDASSTPGLFVLSPLAVDPTSLAIQSVDLKNQPTGEYEIKAFDTQAGVPGAVGTIPSGSTVTFTLWMKKTANWGTMYPRARVRLNNASGSLFRHVGLRDQPAAVHRVRKLVGRRVGLRLPEDAVAPGRCRWYQAYGRPPSSRN